MRVLVLNGSPTGKNSITLQTVNYIALFHEDIEFEVLHAGQQIKAYEKDFSGAEKALEQADLILFCYPVYTFLAPSQLHRFIELIKEHGIDLSGKYAAQITTSKHFYDTTAHRFIKDNCDDLGLRYIHGLSADMEDLLSDKGQKEARAFFRFVLWSMKNGYCGTACYRPAVPAAKTPAAVSGRPADDLKVQEANPLPSEKDPPEQKEKLSASETASGPRIVIVADTSGENDEPLFGMIRHFRKICRCRTELVNIREFSFRGGCLGCFHCASDGSCIYKDGFDSFLREKIQTADAAVYAFTIKDHSMGARFKMFDDRQFCNGHRTVTMGKPVGYIISGNLRDEPNLLTLMEARAQVGGNFLTGIASDDADLQKLAGTLLYAVRHHYNEPKNFYGVGGMKIFRDLIYQMQGLMKEDHRFYKEHGFYDFPQKRKGMIAGMYLVGAMMTNPKISGKMGGKMTEGMLLPYAKVLEKAKSRIRK